MRGKVSVKAYEGRVHGESVSAEGGVRRGRE
jgi:hypothetical protein